MHVVDDSLYLHRQSASELKWLEIAVASAEAERDNDEATRVSIAGSLVAETGEAVVDVCLAFRGKPAPTTTRCTGRAIGAQVAAARRSVDCRTRRRLAMQR